MIFQCLMSNSNFSLQIQTFSNLRKVVQIKPNQISNVKFKSNSNQTSFEALPNVCMIRWYHIVQKYKYSDAYTYTFKCTWLQTCIWALQTPYNNTLTKTWIWNSCFSIGQQGGGPDFGRSIYQPRAFTQCYRSFRQRSSVSLPRWRFGKQNGNKKLWSRITNPSFFVSQ